LADFTIILGNKNYSSWSLRGWLALKQSGADFDEIVIPLRQADTQARILEHSPSARVPALRCDRDGGFVVWDSLAIAEYLAERFPEAGLWPDEATARARARAVSAEMHAGFAALRSALPMDMRLRAAPLGAKLARVPQVAAEIARICELWQGCRREFGQGGDYLFGAFSAADAAFAPVASRFTSYGIALPKAADDYRAAAMAWPAVGEWAAAGAAEPWTIDFPQRDRLAAEPLPRAE
jgi:glutathione S-transferase